MKQITTILLLFLSNSLAAQNAPIITSTAKTEATEDQAYNYTLNASDADNDVVTMSVKDGTTLPDWLTFESGSITTKDFGGSITGPGGVAIDAQGNVYVAQLSGTTIFKITPDGTMTSFATVTASSKYAMLVIGDDLYIAYYNMNKITKLDLTNPGAGEVDWINPITDPLAMVEKDGYIYVAQYSVNKISKIDLSNDNVTDYVTGTPYPFGLGFNSSGALFIASYNNKYLSKFENNVLTANIKSFSASLSDVKLDSKGNIYVSSFGAGVKKLSADLSTTTDISTTGRVWGMTMNDSGTLIWGINDFNKVVSLETGAVLNGTPTNEDVGDHQICLSATDGTDTVDQCFTITVANVNDAPTITGVPASEINIGEEYSFTPIGDDVDVGDVLTFSILNKPSWSSFSPTTGKLSGTPEFSDLGHYNGIVLSVTDASNVTVSLSTFNIEVVDNVAPEPPIVNSQSKQNTLYPTLSGTAEANSTVSISFNDGSHAIQYSVAVNDQGEWSLDTTIADENAVVPTLTDGDYNINLTATDGSGNTSEATIHELMLDTTAPELPVVLDPTTSVLHVANTYEISGSHNEDGITIYLYTDLNNDGLADNSTVLASANVGENTTSAWSLTISLSDNAPNNFVVIAEDELGNRSQEADVPTISMDTDADGVRNDLDACANTPSGEIVDSNGCSNSQKDSDNDGVMDDVDTCANTPNGETADTNGCSDSQKDSDNDGISDAIDICDNTPSGEIADSTGCSASQKDEDGDGVNNEIDECPTTPAGESADANGCSDSQKDSDFDGVNDAEDQCPESPEDEAVDAHGCSDSQKDDDNDGVSNNLDKCPNTPADEVADADGCSDSQKDADGDGVQDSLDNCPMVSNPGQEDRDGDGHGDVCDTLELNASQAFTPNGDGINDTWVISNIENYPNSLVRVFNTWGKEVFSARNYQNNWDGRYKDLGAKLPDAGSYYFQIDYEGDGKVDQDGWLYITSR
ncbi:gliding motility-associated C-terminal domain-containing protein [Arenibacter palladensis]|uniref:Gliding motility-associated C-terminal domain-containing protein n=1 Tax=Arenibacter palladensis TaxID=237373 RepID=A0A1M4Y5C9_9FLAO|nr:gliding motility-associated C-terminal domain-containing protein [Arenibacter palladensis]SHF00905.1 gliding motility-associated C-terminal domain-containing protein [Arenibacter palladensis]